jgi:hypothetical protein
MGGTFFGCFSAGALIALVSSAALATEIGPANWSACLGRPACGIGEARLVAGGAGGAARFAEQADPDRGAVPGLGVQADPGNGFNDPELQGPVSGAGGETIAVEWRRPQRILAITIAHLFNPEHISDDPAERAVIEARAGGERLAVLELTSVDDSTVRLAGAGGGTKRLSLEAGVVLVMDPFDGRAVDRLVFSAPPVPSGDTSDYSIASIRSEPAAE